MAEEDFISLHRRASETLLALTIEGADDSCERRVAKLETIIETEQHARELAINDLQRRLAEGLIEVANCLSNDFKECL